MGALIKHLSTGISTEVIVFFRNFFGLLALVPILLRQQVSLKTRNWHFHAMRGIFGFLAMYTFFYSISLISLSHAVLLSYTTPLFSPFIARVWLKEGLGRAILLAVGLGFIGVIFILRPENPNEIIEIGGLVALTSGFFAAIALNTIRRMSSTEPAMRIVFYHTLIGLLASSILALNNWYLPDSEQMLFLILIGVSATLGQMAITKGYAMSTVAVAGPFTYAAVIFSALFGAIWWGERFDLISLLGTLLVISGGVLALRHSKP